jgi:hypothetical protein
MASFSARLRLGIALAIVPVIALGASSKKQRIDSHWKDREITIDGDNGEWPGPLVPVDEHQRLDAAAFNDGQFLYLVLSTRDATLRAQIIGQGLIVWFDPGGGDKKAFGIKFPVGMGDSEMPGRGRGFHRPDPPPPPGTGESQPSGHALTLEPPNRLEVFGPEKDDAHSFVADKAPGLAVKVGQVEGALVYELKVPLVHTSELPYAIDAKNGALIGLGFETPKREHPAEHEGRGMGGFGGGGGGGGGGMGGRGGMGRSGGMGRGGGGGMGPVDAEPPKPLKTWAVLQLSNPR